MYQFIRGSPGQFVEGMTRQFLAEFGKKKMKLQYEHVILKKDKSNQLKKIEGEIERAQRRLYWAFYGWVLSEIVVFGKSANAGGQVGVQWELW